MKKISKRITALFLSLIIALAIVPIANINIEANAATGEDVVAYARQFIGCPYVSGATGPDAFDCSGFVSYVFKHFGISIPNSTYTVWNNMGTYGTVIDHGSIEKAQAGDIIVWVGHVSIYTSNGNCVEALNARYGVTEAIPVNSHTNGSDYYVLRIPGITAAKIKPDAPVISVDKETAQKSEQITVKWDAAFGADTYRVLCKSGVINYVNSETTATSKTFALAGTGTYTLSVFAKNENGETESNQITITVISASSFTVKYNANGGTGAPASQTKAYDKALTLSKAVPTRSGYKFVEWNTLSTGRGNSYPAGGVYDKNENVTLYAVWENVEHVHDYKTSVTVVPTCEKEGVRTYKCRDCSYSYTEAIPATGHAYGDWVTTKLATVSAAGEKQRTCKTCGKVEKQSIPKLTTDTVVIDKATIALNYKGTATLMANKKVEWSSSNPAVATVDANGNVTATGTGTATISATSGKDSAKCVVQVSYTWWQWIIRTLLLGFLWY